MANTGILLPLPETVIVSEEDCKSIARMLNITQSSVINWGVHRNPITIPNAVDTLDVCRLLGVRVFVITKLMLYPHTSRSIYRAFDTFKIIDPPADVEVWWQTTKIPSERESVCTLSNWHYFIVKNTGDTTHELKILNSYWPQRVDHGSFTHDGIEYVDGFVKFV